MNYAYWLSNIPGIGIRSRNCLIAAAGTAEEVYRLTKRQLLAICGIGERQACQIAESKNRDYEKAFESLKKRGIGFISREEREFPDRLREIPDAPYSLYFLGELPGREDMQKKLVAIVGARRCSAYGHAVAEKLGRELAAAGAGVVSGMAQGIDASGHRGALQGGGKTFAVLGSGVDVCYPAFSRELYGEIAEHGGVISEYPPGTQPKPGLFPARNRIISGLSDVVVVVEARARSGSLITADYALEQGKDIYAVPGRLYDALSEGCNRLIGQGAGMIFDVGEFLDELKICQMKHHGTENFKKLLLEKDENLVYSCLSLRPKSLEQVLDETGMAVPDAADILARLIRKKYIAETARNYYIRQI